MLPDYLAPGLDAVLVGTAAGERSAARGHYYSGIGNKFWELVWEAGLTGDRILVPERDASVLEFGFGLTDLVKGVAASTDNQLRSAQYDLAGFLAKVRRYQPGAVAFNGKTAAGVVARYLGEPKPPLGLAQWTVEGVPGYVLPSSSGSNNDPARFLPKPSKAAWWSEFGAWLHSHLRSHSAH